MKYCATCRTARHMTYLGTFPNHFGVIAAHYQCNHCGVKVMAALAVAPTPPSAYGGGYATAGA
jgi:hypothetical protein